MEMRRKSKNLSKRIEYIYHSRLKYTFNNDKPKLNHCSTLLYFRSDIDKGRYDVLDNCTGASLLTSTFKLFLREMAEPLISKDVRERLYKSLVQYEEDKDVKALVLGMKTILHSLDQISFNVLRYLVFHLRVIAEVKGKSYGPTDCVY